MKIIVIGAGPKGLALHLKACILKKIKFDKVPQIILVDRHGIGGNWNGGNGGYTDGMHKLGTSPNKDLGFPYDSIYSVNNNDFNLETYKYSWDSYLISCKKFKEWIDRGKPQPTHREWTNYMRWVWNFTNLNIKNNNKLIHGEVVHIEISDNKWKVKINTQNGITTLISEGLMLTGPGEPIYAKVSPLENLANMPLILDGKNYWIYKDMLCDRIRGLTLKRQSEIPVIGVLGGGETAAATINSLLENLKDCFFRLVILSRHVSIFSRGESYHENFFYSSPEGENRNWKDYGLELRLEFISRTDRGVFSPDALISINNSPNVELMYLKNDWSATIKGQRVLLQSEHGNFANKEYFDCFIDASGFDPLSVIENQFNVNSQEKLADFVIANLHKLPEENKVNLPITNRLFFAKRNLKYLIDRDLSVEGFSPKLYLPFISGLMQGPGFPNLSSLGRFSDRIFEPIVNKKNK